MEQIDGIVIRGPIPLPQQTFRGTFDTLLITQCERHMVDVQTLEGLLKWPLSWSKGGDLNLITQSRKGSEHRLLAAIERGVLEKNGNVHCLVVTASEVGSIHSQQNFQAGRHDSECDADHNGAVSCCVKDSHDVGCHLVNFER